MDVPAIIVLLLAILLLGCGPSEEEQAALDEFNRKAIEQDALERSYYNSLIENCDDTELTLQLRLDSCVEAFQLSGWNAFSLDGFGLESLPDDFFVGLERMTHLSLSNNRFKSLPSSLARLKNLESLHISDNPFEEIPEAVFSLTRLQVLLAGGTDIKAISPKINQLKELEVLNIASTPLESVPSLAGLTELHELVLSITNIRQLPAGVLDAKNLLILHFSSLPNLDTDNPLPGISRMKNLRLLDIGSNELTEIPVEVAQLRNLQFLSLHGTPIKSLPKELLSHPRLSDDTVIDPYSLGNSNFYYSWGLKTNGIDASYTGLQPNNPSYCSSNIYFQIDQTALYPVNIKTLDICKNANLEDDKFTNKD